MKILVTGVSGQLGFDVVKEGMYRGLDVIGVSSKELDITNEKAVQIKLQEVQPNVIVHCAAYTNVDLAEDEQEACYAVNVTGTKYLAQEAKRLNAKFIYISTDYVFNGKGTVAYTELDSVCPINYYGQTKFQGEEIVRQLVEKFFIVRISWVFGSNGHNFVKTMLQLAKSRDTLTVVGDQIGSPTYTVDLAKVLIDMTQSEKYGIYHVTNEGFCSWADFAIEIYNFANKATTVQAIKSEQYPTKAKRPANSRMDKTKLANTFAVLPSWQDALQRYLKEHKIND